MSSKQSPFASSSLPPRARPRNTSDVFVSQQVRGGSRYRGSSTPPPSASFAIVSASACVATKRKADSLDVDVVDKPMTSDQQVKYAREIGTSRPTKLARDSAIQSHPSRGGSQGFPVSERCFLIDYWVNKLPVPKSRIRSIQRWIKNGVLPLRQSGNKVNNTIRGEHLLLLAMFKKTYPQASNPESACYIAEHSTDGRVLTNGEVTKGLRFLNMTRKKGSTTAYQAFTPKNICGSIIVSGTVKHLEVLWVYLVTSLLMGTRWQS